MRRVKRRSRPWFEGLSLSSLSLDFALRLFFRPLLAAQASRSANGRFLAYRFRLPVSLDRAESAQNGLARGAES
jgi:hypothetical protein